MSLINANIKYVFHMEEILLWKQKGGMALRCDSSMGNTTQWEDLQREIFNIKQLLIFETCK